MKRTISVMVGKGSVNHNSRTFHAKNVDRERSHLNIEYCNENIKDVYHELFDEALARYNEKQIISDRRIDDYYKKIRSGKQEKPFHEIIFQIGNKDDMNAKSEEGILSAKVLDEFMHDFQKRNPTLRVFSAHLYMDEATPHLHIDFVPYITGSKRGLDTRVSLKQALGALGFKGGTRSDSELNQWVYAEKQQLAAIMEWHDIVWEQKGTHEKHLSVLDFEKQERAKEVAELEERKEILQEENSTFHEINERLHDQLVNLDDEIYNLNKDIEKSKEEAEEARKQAEKYRKKMNELAPMVTNMERLAAEFSTDPEKALPEAATLESAKTYREKKAKPMVQKIVKVLRSVYSAYLDISRRFNKLQQSYNRAVEKADNLSERFHEVYEENQELWGIVRDFNRVKNAIGHEQVANIAHMERQREQAIEEQKRAQRKKRDRGAR